MADRPPRDLSSPSGAVLPVERVRGERPDDPTWRADALVRSRHSRLVDELRQPLESHDKERARQICGEVTRLLMRDLAPALILLPPAERYRLQALIAYSLTLFDFVRQTGLEGERLAAINRWEFHLEAALDGTPPGQPVFVLLADIESHDPWVREGFDRLHAVARHRCAVARPANRAALEKEAVDLAVAVTTAFLGSGSPELVELVAAVMRAGSLVNLGEDLRRHRARLPVSELPDAWENKPAEPAPQLDRLVRTECSRIVPALASGEGATAAPSNLRRAIEYVRLACLDLVQQIDRLGAEVIAVPPRLSLTDRLLLLARARWLGR